MGHSIIVVVADTLRTPNSLPTGAFELAAPFLTALASSGRTLPNFIASSSWTYPSHLALLHGLEPWEDPREHSGPGLPERGTLSEVCTGVGVRSIAVSRNPIVSGPTGVLRGYGEVRSGPLASRHGLAPMMNCVWDPLDAWLARRPERTRFAAALTSGARMASRLVALGLAHRARAAYDRNGILRDVRSALATRNRSTPTHLFVNLMDAHEPYLPERFSRLADEARGPPASSNLALHSPSTELPPSSRALLVRRYLQAVSRLDASVSELFGELRRAELLNDATVVIVSDHGQSLGEHDFLGHGRYLYDELVRVPCLLWSSGDDDSREALPNGYFDHRHLYEVLRASLEADTAPTARSWTEAVTLRGPAYSFVRWRPYERSNPLRRQRARDTWRRFPAGDEVPPETTDGRRTGGRSGGTDEPDRAGEASPEPWPEWTPPDLPAPSESSEPLPLDSWGYGG